jgi:uncharacterized protein with PIN domain
MEAQSELRFLVDRTAGKLARWLRILGFDAEYIATCEPASIARQARQSGRRVVTRNKRLADRLGADAMLLESEQLEEQIRQVVAGVGPELCDPFSRCNVCNARLVGVEKEQVKGRVPRYVYSHHEDFAVCPICGRYYWQGTHWRNMADEITRIVEVESHENRKGPD